MEDPTKDKNPSEEPPREHAEGPEGAVAGEEATVPPAAGAWSGWAPPFGSAPWNSGAQNYGPPSYGPEMAWWHQGPSQQEEPATVGQPSLRVPPRRSRTALVVALVALLLVSVGLGVVIGHAVWTSTLSTPTSLPTTSVPPSTVPATTPSSSPTGAPPNAASIATHTDPGLVDINVSDAYEALQGAATGMVLSSSGEILTNNHVIEGATTIRVTDIGNGKTYDATVLGYDRSHDIAVLQLTGASGLKTVDLGDSSTVRTTDGVVAVGNAEGAGGTPSYAAGTVTATDQSISAEDALTGGSEQLSGLIETDASIVPGDSGGALVDSAGQVIGMVTAGSEGFRFQPSVNEGFAIPIDEAAATAREIESGRSSSTVHVGPTAFLGVQVESSFSGVPGAEIVAVVPGGAAARAGLTAGDTITVFDGQTVSSPDSLTGLLLSERPGASVKVQYLDLSGQQQSVTVRLASGPPQ